MRDAALARGASWLEAHNATLHASNFSSHLITKDLELSTAGFDEQGRPQKPFVVSNAGSVLEKFGISGVTDASTPAGWTRIEYTVMSADQWASAKTGAGLLVEIMELEHGGAIPAGLKGLAVLDAALTVWEIVQIGERLEAGDYQGAADATLSLISDLALGSAGYVVGFALASALLATAPVSAPVLAVLTIVAGIAGGSLAAALGGDLLDPILQPVKDWLAGVYEDVFGDGNGNGVPDWLDGLNAFFNPPISPLVLDLDGDGVELTALADSRAHFDLNTNGLAEKTAWISGDDAFLAFDRNGNGRIDDLSELFGGEEVDGFTVLAGLDSNGDGVIDAQDDAFENLVLWRDADGDGATDAGELTSLGAAGVASIDLDAQYVNQWSGKSWISHRSSWTANDGSVHVVDDVWFDNDQTFTIDRNAGVGDRSAGLLLPEIVGYGTVRDLSLQVATDAELLATVTALVRDVGSLPTGELTTRIEQLLLQWAGVESVNPTSRGSHVDARHLAFLEAIHGQGFVAWDGKPTPGPNASAALERYYDQVVSSMSVRVLIQLPVTHALLTGDTSLLESGPLSILGALSFDRVNDAVVALPENVDAVTARLSAALQEAIDPLSAALDNLQVLSMLPDAARALVADAVVAVARPYLPAAVYDHVVENGSVDGLITGGRYNDNLSGTAGDDVFVGRAGDDTLSGGDGDDTYVWSRGDGSDTIVEATFAGTADRLVLEGVLPSQVRLSSPDGSTVVLTIEESAPGAGDGGSITLRDSLGDYHERGVEIIEFADGTVWDRATLRASFTAGAGTSGNDVINGTGAADVLRGGGGDDTLRGGDGDDTYVWARGDGRDAIVESTNDGTKDRLVLEGVLASQVRLSSPDGSTALLTIAESSAGAGDGGSVRLWDSLVDYYERGVELVEFADGTVWDRAALRARYLADVSTTGNDTVTGTDEADVVRAGAGNDTITGNDGDDTFVWARGDGHDVIIEATNDGTADRLVLEGVLASQVQVGGSDGSTVWLTIAESAPGAGDGGSVTLRDSLVDHYERGVELVEFADGTVWDRAALRAAYLTGVATTGNDTIVGTDVADVVRGRGGNDTITGNDGDDTYVWARGDGNDTIVEATYDGIADRVVLEGVLPSEVQVVRSGSTLVLRIAASTPGAGDGGSVALRDSWTDYHERGVELVEFADGTVWDRAALVLAADCTTGSADDETIAGTKSADRLVGGLGNDTLDGGDGDDTYVWARGDGHDTINESTSNGAADRLVLEGVLPSEVHLSSTDGATVVVTIADGSPGAGDGGSITLTNSLADYYERGVELIEFADGSVWDRVTLRARYLVDAATADNDVLVGTDAADVVRAGAGNDTITGNDGDDTFVWARGDGHDVIVEATYDGTADRLVLEGVLASQVQVGGWDGSTVRLTVAESAPGAGDGGSVTLRDSLGDYYERGVELVEFADGTVWDRAALRAAYLAGVATAGNDTIAGTDDADVIRAGTGNDTITGNDGDDTYVWAHGDGDDRIIEAMYDGTADRLVLEGVSASQVRLSSSDGSTVVLTVAESAPGAGDGGTIRLDEALADYYERGVDVVELGDGTVWDRAALRARYLADVSTTDNDVVVGTDAADVVRAGAGDDTITGNDGDDTYLWARGDGSDTIIEATNDGTADRLVLEGVLTSQVSVFSRDGSTVVIRVAESAPGAGDGGSITLRDSLVDHYERGVELVEFADGTVWDRVTLRARSLESVFTPGDDTVVGTAADDVYVWTPGGRDVLTEATNDGLADRLVVVGALPSQVRLSSTDGSTLVLTVTESAPGAGDGGSITLTHSLVDHYERGIEFVELADGTVWDRAALRARYLADASTSASDTIVGTDVADVVRAGRGDDTITGNDGDDTYVWARGDGNDTIVEATYDGTRDRLVLEGVLPSQVRLGSTDGATLLLTVTESAPGAGDGGTITLRGALDASYERGVELVELADGTVWDTAALRARYLADVATSGNDTIVGTDVADVVRAGAGDDTITGNDGDDTYVWSRGDGNDTIIEATYDGTADRLVLEDVPASQVRLSSPDGSTVVLTVAESAPGAGDGGSITLRDALDEYYERGVDLVEFADGTVWDRTALRARYLSDAFTSAGETVYGTAADDAFVWSRGGGHDTIVEASYEGTADRLVLRDVLASQVRVSSSDGTTAVITVAESAPGAGDGGSVTLKDSLVGTYERGVELVEFADGTVWDRAALRAAFNADALTPDDDVVKGTTADDVYVWRRGGGSDSITEAYDGGNDRLVLDGVLPDDVVLSRNSNTVLLSIADSAPGARDGGLLTLANTYYDRNGYGVEQIEFADGTVWTQADMKAMLTAPATDGNDRLFGTSSSETISALAGDDVVYGGAGSDVINGGAGDDVLTGNAGSDTFVFEVGSGHDTITDFTPRSRGGSYDTVRIIGHDVTTFAELISAATEWDGGTLLDLGDGSTIDLLGIRTADLGASDFKFS